MGACTSKPKNKPLSDPNNPNDTKKNPSDQDDKKAISINPKVENVENKQTPSKTPSITNKDKKENDKPDPSSPNQEAKEQLNAEEQYKAHTSLVNQQSELIHKFDPTQSVMQSKITNYFSNNYITSGESIVISFGDSFNIFNSFYDSVYQDHFPLPGGPPRFIPTVALSETRNGYKPRGIAVDVPQSQYEIYKDSRIKDDFPESNIMFNMNPSDENVFIKAFYDENTTNNIEEAFRREVEKCNFLHEIHFISNIFNGPAMGLLISFFYRLQNGFDKTLKVCHLKYYDTFAHKSFSKRKNYIFSVGYLHNQCNLINLFNTDMTGGKIMNTMTLGGRLGEPQYSLNKMLGSLLMEPRANFVYSNGVEMKEENYDLRKQLVFKDCKEGKRHLNYYPQYSSLCMYKGNNLLNEERKTFFDRELLKIVQRKLHTNKGYYSFIHFDKDFHSDFATNIHQTDYFRELTDEYLMDFLQDYNIDNFTKEEKELREDTISRVNQVLNYYKEMWKVRK